MKNTYAITGMTCTGCQASIQKAIKEIESVSDVTVSLETGEAIVYSDAPIPLDVLRTHLPSKYGIAHKNAQSNEANDAAAVQNSKLNQLKPLFLIFLYISVASVLLHWQEWDAQAAMLDFMGLFFVVFSFFKLLDLQGFQQSFQMYDPLAKVLPQYGWVYPFIETALGLSFLMRFQIVAALVLTVVLLTITTVGVTRSLLSRSKIRCACLGTALNLPMTEATFIENAIMIGMAIAMILTLL
jgi:cation transport ATPase